MYLEIDEDFPEHPKTIRFCAAIANPIGWAYLIKLWRWCCKFQKDGDLSSYEPAEIEVAVGWVAMDGRFVAAAVKAGFIDHDAGGMRVHNWMKRQGKAMLRMEIDRIRKAFDKADRAGDKESAAALAASLADAKNRLALLAGSAGYPSARTGTGEDSVGRPLEIQQRSEVPNQDRPDQTKKDQTEGDAPAPARDPGTTGTETGPPPRPLSLAKPRRPTAHEVKIRFGEIRSELSGGVFLTWDSPTDPRGETAAWIAGLSDEAVPDLEQAMRLAIANMRDRVRDWDNPKFWEDVNYGFATFRARFTALREALHGRSAKQRAAAAGARASPSAAETSRELEEKATCSYHREIPDKPSSDFYAWCRTCKRLGSRKPRHTGPTEPETLSGAK